MYIQKNYEFKAIKGPTLTVDLKEYLDFIITNINQMFLFAYLEPAALFPPPG